MAKNRILIQFMLIIGALAIGALGFSFIRQRNHVEKLSSTINTLNEGYPIAVRLKEGVSPGAYFTGAIVELDCTAENFQTRTITYGFHVSQKKQIIFVTVDNPTRSAYAWTADDPKSPFVPPESFENLSLTAKTKDIPEILQSAKTTELAEFCRMVPLDARDVDLQLSSDKSRAIWLVNADGWDKKGPIADLHITMDAITGEVISQTLDKGVGRK